MRLIDKLVVAGFFGSLCIRMCLGKTTRRNSHFRYLL